MGVYRKIDCRIHNDQKFRTLDDQTKLLFFTLLTHPHMTSLGAMRGSCEGLAIEMGWQFEDAAISMEYLQGQGMVNYDPKACYIDLPNWFKFNPAENPNVVKSWEYALTQIPECEARERLITRACESLKEKTEGFREALPKAFRKGLLNQEQEQEQEQELNTHGHQGQFPPFVVFWAEWEPKVKKLETEKIWEKMKSEDCIDAYEGIAAHKASRRFKEGFRMHPTTYLRGRRWEDEPEPEVSKSQPSKAPDAEVGWNDYVMTEEERERFIEAVKRKGEL